MRAMAWVRGSIHCDYAPPVSLSVTSRADEATQGLAVEVQDTIKLAVGAPAFLAAVESARAAMQEYVRERHGW
jgi:hypothetical protein